MEAKDSELFLVVGDAEGGIAKIGRNPEFQAVLPLERKVYDLNCGMSQSLGSFESTIESTVDTADQTADFQDVLQALGLSLRNSADGNENELAKLVYGKVIILAAEEDDDKNVVRALLGFLMKNARALLEGGFVYIARLPMYQLRKGKLSHFYYSDAELDELIPEEREAILQVTRVIDILPWDLWNATMNPDTRKLKRVSISSPDQ